MFILLIVVALLLVGAVGLRLTARGPAAAVLLLKAGVPCLALILLTIMIFRSGGEVTPSKIVVDDGVSRTMGIVSCLTLLLLGMIESSPVLVAALFWGAGLTCLCASSALPAMQWGALLLSTLPVVFYGRTTGASRPGILSRHPALMLGAGLFSIGFWVLTFIDREHPGATIAVILLVSGLGGMLGWFPFPRVRSLAGDETSPAAIFARRLFPCLTAGVLLLRMIERNPFGSSQLVLVALAAAFSLILCGARLLKEERLSSRLVLSSLSLFGFLLFAVCLCNWEVQNAKRDWATSNLPSGSSLFASMIACEMAGLLVLVCGFQLMQSSGEEGDFSQTLTGACGRRPFFGAATVCGLLSVAGLPPSPGFWWRLGLVSACLLPHRQSNVTQVMETDHLYSAMGVLLAGLLILHAVGHLPLLQRLLFEDAFRMRTERVAGSIRYATVMSLLLLAAMMCLPLSIGPFLARAEPGSPPSVTVFNAN